MKTVNQTEGLTNTSFYLKQRVGKKFVTCDINARRSSSKLIVLTTEYVHVADRNFPL